MNLVINPTAETEMVGYKVTLFGLGEEECFEVRSATVEPSGWLTYVTRGKTFMVPSTRVVDVEMRPGVHTLKLVDEEDGSVFDFHWACSDICAQKVRNEYATEGVVIQQDFEHPDVPLVCEGCQRWLVKDLDA